MSDFMRGGTERNGIKVTATMRGPDAGNEGAHILIE